MLTSARRVGGIVSPITGIEGVDIAAATELGIVVGNGQTRENTESVAEATILFMLAALYDLHGTETVLRNNLPRPPRMNAPMLQGKTPSGIGFGQIARAMTLCLAGWGVDDLTLGCVGFLQTRLVLFVADDGGRMVRATEHIEASQARHRGVGQRASEPRV